MVGMNRIGTDIVQTVELTVESQIEGLGRVDVNAHLHTAEEWDGGRKGLDGCLEIVHHLLLQCRIHVRRKLKKYNMFYHNRLFFVVSFLFFLIY